MAWESSVTQKTVGGDSRIIFETSLVETVISGSPAFLDAGSFLGARICEACGEAQAKRDDILCLDCSRAYGILVDLLTDHPGLGGKDLRRIVEMYEWYAKKKQATLIQR